MPHQGKKATALVFGRRPWLKLAAATAVGVVIAASAVIPAQAATGDVSAAEGVLVSGSGLVNPNVVQLGGAYSATNPATSGGVVSNPLDLSALNTVGVGLGNGVQLLGSSGLLTLGVDGQYANSTPTSATASSGLVGSDGSISVGAGTPGGTSTLNLTPLLQNVTGASAVASAAQLNLGALASSITAQRGASVTTNTSYGIASANFTATSPAIAGLTTSLQSTVNGVGSTLNTALSTAAPAVVSGSTGALTTALNSVIPGALSLKGTSATVSVTGLSLSGLVSPLLSHVYTSGGVTVNPSTGQVVIDLNTLQALNGQDPNTELLTSAAITTLVKAALQDILVNQIPAAINTAVQQAIGNATVNVQINTTAAVAGLNVATIGLGITTPLSNLGSATPAPATVTATVSVIGGLISLNVGQVLSAVTPVITSTVLPILSGLVAPTITGVTSTLAAVTTPVNTIVAPLFGILNQIVSLTVNAQDTTTGFQDARGTDAGAKSVHALQLSILGATGLATVDLATSTVAATTVAPLTVATPTANQQFTVATPTATTSVPFSGTGEPGATVAVTLAPGGKTGTATVGSDGTWSTSIAGVGTATYSASVAQTFGGVTGTPVTRAFTVVAQQPLTITGPTEGLAYTVVSSSATTPVTISGTATPGATVALSLAGTTGAPITGSATAAADGTWTTTIASVPVDAYTISATQTSGGVTSAAVTRGFSVVAGNALTVTTPTDNTQYVVPGANSTTSVPVSGTAQPGASIQISLGSGLTATTTALADGSWSTQVLAVPVAPNYAVSVTQTVAGTASAPVTRSISVVAANPVVITSPSVNAQFVVADGSSTTSVTLSGTAQAGAAVSVQLKTGVTAQTTADVTGKWSVTFTGVGVADYTANATQTVSGITSSPVTRAFSVVAGSPVAVTSPANGSTTTVADASNTLGVTVKGTAQPNASVTVTLASGTTSTITADGTGAWSTSFPGVGVGTYTITAAQTVNGTTSVPVSSVYTIQAGAPVVIAAPADQSTVVVAGSGQKADVTVSGTAQPNAAIDVTIGGLERTTTASGTGAWSVVVPSVPIGTPTISVTQTVAGTTSPAVTEKITVAAGTPVAITAPAPNASVTVLGDNGTTDVVVSGTGQVGASIVASLGGAVPDRSATVSSSGTWTVTFPTVGVADYTLTASQTINGTTASTAGQDFSVVAGEGIIVTSPATGTSFVVADANGTHTVLVSGVATLGAAIHVSLSPTLSEDTTANGTTGAWSVSFPSLPVAAYTVTATQTVGAQTTVAPTTTFSVTAGAPVVVTSPTPGGTVLVAQGDSTVTVPITGIAQPGAAIVVTVGGSAPISTTAAADGSWSVTSPAEPVSATAYPVVVTQTLNGTTSAGVDTDFTVTAGQAFAVTTPVADASFLVADGSVKQDVTVGGTGQPGALVSIALGSAPAQTTRVDTSGNWSILFPQLSMGSYSVASFETVGATKTSSDTRTFTIKADAAVTVTSPASGATLPIAAGDSTPVTITGRSAGGASISVSLGSGAPLTTTADGAGDWSVTTAALPVGGYSAAVTQTIAGEGTSLPVTSTFSLTAAPALVVTTPGDGTRIIVADTGNTATVPVSGTAAPHAIVNFTFTGPLTGTVTGTATADATGAWSVAAPGVAGIGIGANTLTATQVVPATTSVTTPTTSAEVTSSVIVATGAPIAIVSPADPSTIFVASAAGKTDVVISGTAQPMAAVSVAVNSGTPIPLTADGSGNWSTTLTSRPTGTYTIDATQTVGGTTSAAVHSTVTVKAGDPVVVTSPADTSTVFIPTAATTTDLPVTGTAQAGALVTVQLENGIAASATAKADGAWSLTLADVPVGAHTLSVTQAISGTTSGATVSNVTVANAAAVTITSPAANATLSVSTAQATADVTVTGTAQPNATVTVDVGDGTGTGFGAPAIADDQGAWSTTVAAVPVGEYTVSVTQRVGATTSPAVEQPLHIAVAAPVTIATPVDGTSIAVATTGSTVNVPVSGTAQPAAKVTVTLDGDSHIVTADDQGAWNTTYLAIGTGPHTVTAAEATADGSTTPVTSKISIEVAPAVVITTPQADQQFQVATGGSTDVVVSGTGTPGASLQVTLDAGAPVAATVAGNGSWTTTFPAVGMTPATHSVAVVQTVGGTAQAPVDVTFSVVGSSTPVAALTVTTPTPGLIIPDTNGDGLIDVPVAGTGEPDSTITVTIGDGHEKTVTVDSNGHWSTTVTGVPVGASTVVVTQTTGTDVTGSVSVPIDGRAIAPVVITSPTSSTKPLSVGAPDSTVDVTITGKAQIGATVTADLGGGLTATGPVASDGSFSLVVHGVPVGTTTAKVTETIDGATTAPVSVPVVVQLAAAVTVTAPTAAGDTYVVATDGTTVDVPVSGTATAGTTVDVSIDGSATPVSITVASDGTWSATLPGVGTGAHTISVSQTLADGKTTPVTRTATVSVAASAVITAPVDQQQFQVPSGQTAQVAVTGTGQPGASLALTLDGTSSGTVTVSTRGTWSATFSPVAIGSHKVTATQTVGGTEQASVSVTFSVAATAHQAEPVVVTSPAPGQVVLDTTGSGTVDFAVVGTGEPDSTITVDLGNGITRQTVVDEGGNWSVSLTDVPVGAITAAVTQKTAGTTTGSASVSFTAATLAPVTITAPTAGQVLTQATTGGGVNFTATGTAQPSAHVGVTLDSGDVTQVTADGTGAWSLPLTALATGNHTLSATETVNGSTSAPVTVSFAVQAAPTDGASIWIDTPAQNTLVYDRNSNGSEDLTATGGAAPDTLVTVVLDGASPVVRIPGVRINAALRTTYTTMSDSTGFWRVRFLTVPIGDHEFTASQNVLGVTQTTPQQLFAVAGVAPLTVATPVAGAVFTAGADGTTNVPISGTSEPAATVSVSLDGGTPVSVTSADDTGVWSILFRNVRLGSHTFAATQSIGVFTSDPVSTTFSVRAQSTTSIPVGGGGTGGGNGGGGTGTGGNGGTGTGSGNGAGNGAGSGVSPAGTGGTTTTGGFGPTQVVQQALAFTGSTVLPWAAVGAGILVLGLGMLGASRALSRIRTRRR